MPRLQLTDEEVEIIEARRRRNTAALANNTAIDRALTVSIDWLNDLEVGSPKATRDSLLEALQALKEPLRN